MALKTVIESLDGLDETLVPFYTETDGKFVLQVDGVDAHPEVANLKSAYERTKADRDTARTERDAAKALAKDFPDDFDMSVWKKAKDGKADEAAIASIQAEYDAQIAAKDQEISGLKSAGSKAKTESEIDHYLSSGGVTSPLYRRAARRDLLDMVTTADDGTSMVETKFGPKPIADFIPQYLAGEGKEFVTPPKGGGAQGNDGGAKKQSLAELSGQERRDLAETNPAAFKALVESARDG